MSSPLALSEVYWYFAVDADKDLTSDSMAFSLDLATWSAGVFAAPSEAAQARILQTHPVADGYTRFWWQALSGASNDLPFVRDAKQFVYGRLTDSPQIPYFKWYVSVGI